MKKETIVLGLALCLLGGFAAGLLVRWPGSQPSTEGAEVTLSHPVLGPADALVKIIEISDFQCPYCARGALEVMPEVVGMFPGKVSVEFWHNPLDFHEFAEPAARAATAAHLQGKFEPMHDALFRNRKSLTPDRIVALAAEVGLDVERFKWDMADPRVARFVAADKAAVAAIGLSGTPMFLVNGRVVQGAQPPENFRTLIEEELKKAEEALAGGTDRTRLAEALATQNGADAKYIQFFVRGESALPAPVEEKKKKPAAAEADPSVVWRVLVDPADPAIGSPSAPATVVVFSDFQCPYSGKGTALLKRILEDQSGSVRVVFKNFPLPFHKEAFAASHVAMSAAARGKFWEFHDLLFANQKDLSRDALLGYVAELGLPKDEIAAELDAGKFKDLVQRHMSEGESVGVKGTPNFFINGRVIKGAKSYDEVRPLLEQEIARGKELLAKGVTTPYEELTRDGKVFEPFESRVSRFDMNGAGMLGDGKEVELVLFSDFQCPYCRTFAEPVKEVAKHYGPRARLVFMQFPLGFHKQAHLAAQASLAAAIQGKFWEMHDLLFENNKALERADLEKYAEKIGLNMARFRKDLDEGTWKGEVDRQMAAGKKAGVRGTPSLFVNGRQYVGGGRDAAAIVKAIDKHVLAR
jgi:protein-disulfide isomerase